MPSTTNFGWTTPADTDLVKDGAAAIRTLGNGVDASFVDLKGGTTGQILSKNSNTDLDFTWINNDQGDITGVTAGTGISGGGTSGTVTITNSMATEITASGDIIVGTGSGTFDNLPIGTTGQVLTADTTVSPYKVKWATLSVPAFVSLASGSLSGSAVTISSISGSYTDLYLIINAPDQSVLIDDDSGNNFDGYILESSTNNAAITTVTQLNTGNIYPSYNGVGTSQVQIICHVYNYANTTARKIYNLAASGGNNCDSAQWASRSTAAVSQLSINAAAGSFAAGTYTLYGVK